MRRSLLLVTASALLLTAAAVPAMAYQAESESQDVVVKSKRQNRISKGATGLNLAIKDTPQSISTIGKDEILNFGTTGTNDALRLGTGITVDQYETNRATYNARGFDIVNTQIDGTGMSNDWGTVVGQQDSFVFEKIELIRGANGLLTGVGNASGTINYVRKRPLNTDAGLAEVTLGSYDLKRVAVDYNKVLTSDGNWAARGVVIHEDKESYLRGLENGRTTLYGVVDGQVNDNGVVTLGYTFVNSEQNAPMWGSLIFMYPDGSQADFPVSTSPSAEWAYWDVQSHTAFAEYTHQLSDTWEAKLTYNYRKADEDTALLYIFGALQPDNTGAVGWPYSAVVTSENHLFDASVNGTFGAFGRQHKLIAGISPSVSETETDRRPFSDNFLYMPLPAIPYGSGAYPRPDFGAPIPDTGGKVELTRAYAATQLELTDRLKAIVGFNAVKLHREGSTRYGNAGTVSYPDTDEITPYAGVTYDFTDTLLGYVSYSDIFQNQDQTDYDEVYLDPTKGVNVEAGIKSDLFGGRVLATAAVFSAEQKGLATLAGTNANNNYYYVPVDVKSEGVEFEVVGRITENSNLRLGLTHLSLNGVNGGETFEWIPRTTFNFMFDTQLTSAPKVKLGVGGKWQSKTYALGGAEQPGYMVVNGFALYNLTDRADLRLNINNLLDEKYLTTVAFGGYYGAPRNVSLSLLYKF